MNHPECQGDPKYILVSTDEKNHRFSAVPIWLKITQISVDISIDYLGPEDTHLM